MPTDRNRDGSARLPSDNPNWCAHDYKDVPEEGQSVVACVYCGQRALRAAKWDPDRVNAPHVHHWVRWTVDDNGVVTERVVCAEHPVPVVRIEGTPDAD